MKRTMPVGVVRFSMRGNDSYAGCNIQTRRPKPVESKQIRRDSAGEVGLSGRVGNVDGTIEVLFPGRSIA